MNASGAQRYWGFYTIKEWRVACLLFVSYIALYEVALYFLPAGTGIYPAAAIVIASLFFGGIQLWPVGYLAAIVAAFMVGAPAFAIIVTPIGVVLQSVSAAYMLHAARVDPLFRRYRDTFFTIGIIAGISVITPTVDFLTDSFYRLPHSAMMWGHSYIASTCVLLVLTPFLLRWFAKPHFYRQPIEVIETVAVFVLLGFLDFMLFVEGVQSLGGVPFSYFLLFPLFWIALRLRPRFVTLALLLTGLFAITSVILYAPAGMVGIQLFSTETFLIALSVSFFIVASLEEDRRVNTNIMRTQLHMLENAVERIRTESRAKNDFIAILAHELRNPLAPVLSGIDLLRLKSARDSEDMETLQMMGEQMTTVRRLLDDLLDISHISEGKVSLKRETVALDGILRRAILSTNHHRQDLHQSIIVHMPRNSVRVAADPVRLEQIFSNLLTNASKYSDSGDTVTITVRDEIETVEVEVADQGVGLHQNALKGIFMPFSQIEQGERTAKGLGIGLALVQAFAEMHGGNVRAESDGPGRGSRFIVRLPTVLSDESKKSTSTTGPALLAGVSNGVLVLIVDDNDAAAGAIGRLLELQGYAVAYAYNGTQALRQARVLLPQAVVLDLGLPGDDGYVVAQRLREEGYEGKLIALSGYSDEESKQRANEAGFEDYLVKPASLTDLRRVLPEAR